MKNADQNPQDGDANDNQWHCMLTGALVRGKKIMLPLPELTRHLEAAVDFQVMECKMHHLFSQLL